MAPVLNLCLHAGAHLTTLPTVRAVPTPGATATWQPVAHADFVDTVHRALARAGLEVTAESHALWGNGARYFGLLQLSDGTARAEHAPVVGLRNSYDKSLPAGLVSGTGVFVCDNLAFSGEIRVGRRHTTGILRDLPKIVAGSVGHLHELTRAQDHRIARYQHTALDDRDAHDLVVRAVDARAIPLRQLAPVLREWRHPRHAAFAPRTAWSLFNAFTEVLKPSPAPALVPRTIALHALFDTVVTGAGAPGTREAAA